MKHLIRSFREAIGPNGINRPLDTEYQPKYIKVIFAGRTFKTGIEIIWGTKQLSLYRSHRSGKWHFMGNRSNLYDFEYHTWTGFFTLIAPSPWKS